MFKVIYRRRCIAIHRRRRCKKGQSIAWCPYGALPPTEAMHCPQRFCEALHPKVLRSIAPKGFAKHCPQRFCGPRRGKQNWGKTSGAMHGWNHRLKSKALPLLTSPSAMYGNRLPYLLPLGAMHASAKRLIVALRALRLKQWVKPSIKKRSLKQKNVQKKECDKKKYVQKK